MPSMKEMDRWKKREMGIKERGRKDGGEGVYVGKMLRLVTKQQKQKGKHLPSDRTGL